MRHIKPCILGIILFIITGIVYSQQPKQPTAAEILLSLKKLNVLGSVLYVAAHPDDENTRLITYFANEKLLYTGYLSVTRGDGGQNLIGPEIRELLGLIRTQELLAARRIDGGKQFFTRANDFGYSKTADETLMFWDKDKVLSDVVWAIRKFRPDVIITRFPTDGRGGHGHHTSSAILAGEAFDLGNNPRIYPEQLKYVKPWQPKRLLLNTGRWWNNDINESTEGVIAVDAGVYNPLLGRSYTEIASISRSQHKSQGFGSTGTRGSSLEYLEHIKGDKAINDLFDGIDISWNRVGAGNIEKMVNKAIDKFHWTDPATIVPELIEIRKAISEVKDGFWRKRKLEEVDDLIKSVMGLYLEAAATDFSYAPADSMEVKFEAINRSNISINLKKVEIVGQQKDTLINTQLLNNSRLNFSLRTKLAEGLDYSQPYWLVDAPEMGMYNVKDQRNIGKPESDPAIFAEYSLEVNGQLISYTLPVIYKWRDPVGGEVYRPLEITPPVFVNLEEKVLVFANHKPKEISVLVKSGTSNINGIVTLNIPSGWKFEPSQFQVNMEGKGEEQKINFLVYPPDEQSVGTLSVNVKIDGDVYNRSLLRINYDHIPIQTIYPRAESRIVKLNIEKKGESVGYIMGAGDDVPASLEQIGYKVWTMKDEEITPENLETLDALILGVRALNTNDRIKFYMPILLEYVKQGGTLIVQYNTSRSLNTNEFAPYPLTLSRDRVSEEDAEVTILAPDHPVMNTPNKITSSDFDGWVQERGLYFPNQWSEEYTAILSSHDKTEDPKNGGLLVAKYGSGYYIYSGYSWFRQLPAGVPGAYRLFTNMISLGQKNVTRNAKLSRNNK